jgi:putative glutamine amidotransferase
VASGEVYDVDAEQDGFDLAVAVWALERGVPMLAVCRGAQVVNVARGGSLEQHMGSAHLHLVQQVRVDDDDLAAVLGTRAVEVSCFHHQRLAELGGGLRPAATAPDGTVEAVTARDLPGWFLGVQWHPEDTADADPVQQALFRELVRQSARPRPNPRGS